MLLQHVLAQVSHGADHLLAHLAGRQALVDLNVSPQGMLAGVFPSADQAGADGDGEC